MLTLENVLAIEAQELSINRSALLLNVQPCVLSKFVNDNKIFWRGKGIAFAKSVGNGIRQSTSKKAYSRQGRSGKCKAISLGIRQ